jgi:hypothetical protein
MVPAVGESSDVIFVFLLLQAIVKNTTVTNAQLSHFLFIRTFLSLVVWIDASIQPKPTIQ